MHLLSQISIHFDSGKAPSRSNDRTMRMTWNLEPLFTNLKMNAETGSHTLSRAAQCGRHSPPVAAVGSSSSAHTTFPMLHSQMWLLATTMESEDTESSLSAEAVSYSSRRHLLNTTSIWWALTIRLSWFIGFDAMFPDTLKYKITAFIEHLLCARHYTKHSLST